MVKEGYLTLFFIFFKSILKKISFNLDFEIYLSKAIYKIYFGLVFFVALFVIQSSFAYQSRPLSLYPNADFSSLQNSSKNTNSTKLHVARIGVTESYYALPSTPCFFYFNQFPQLLYDAFQFGMSCAYSRSQLVSFLGEIYPEYDSIQGDSKYALLFGAGMNVDLSKGERRYLVSLQGRYSFWDQKVQSVSTDASTRELLQLWGHIFDSNLSLSFIYNKKQGSKDCEPSYSLQALYQQSVPLELRQFGGLQDSDSVEYKVISVSYRKRSPFGIIYGFGLGYWVVTFNGLRISAPLPSFYFGYDI